MNCAIEGICRGNGKVFIKLLVSGISNPASLTTLAGMNGKRIPVITEARPTNENHASLLIALPFLEKRECNLSILDLDNQEGTKTTLSLNFEKAKWQSRLAYKTRKAFCASIRNFDKNLEYKNACFSFWDCIPKGEAVVVRGSAYLPADLTNNYSIVCYDPRFNEIETCPIILGEKLFSPERASGLILKEVQFSISLPSAPSQNFIFCLKDKKGNYLDGFTVLESFILEQIKNDNGFLTRNAQIDSEYCTWFDDRKPSEKDMKLQRSCTFPVMPLFSIIVPLYKTPEPFFNDMLSSVLQQTYSKWELVLVNASPEDSKLSNLASTAQSSDQRIKLVTMIENKGISENTNAGIEASAGDFICFFDHDDLLEPNLLFEYARAINKNPETDLLYCDEDKLMPDGKLAQPFFKPDFSIDLLRNNNYICHMLTIRKSLYDQLEPNTKEFDGAQDHNLTLQASEKARHIHHVPKVLYHWRISENSTAANADTKPYATEAGIRAVQNHLDRMGLKANVHQSRRPFTYTIKYAVPEDKPLVSIIVPTKDHIDLLSRCVDSIIDKSTYDNYEILLVENNSTNQATFDYYKAIEAKHPGIIRTVFWPAEFNFSKLMNFGTAQAKGDYLLLLNNDTEVITPDWIETMLGIAARPEVGIVGVRLYYPDDTIQHAGLCVTGSVAGHLGRNLPKGNWGYFALHDAEQNLSAVTAACMMTKREVFEKTRGWTEELSVAFNDVDFCLKAREEGYLVVYTPEVELYHYESVSRGQEDNAEKKIRFHKEVAYMNYRWAKYYVEGDPYINPNVSHGDPANCYYRLR